MSAITKLKKKIKELEGKIERIQEECSHPGDCLTEKYGSNTGNYDPSADCYWTTFTCELCEKTWTECKEANTYV